MDTRGWTRRQLLRVGSIAALAASTVERAQAGMFLLKTFLGRPPRDTPFITPNRDFYIVTYSESAYLLIKDLPAEQWALRVGGRVRQPLTLSHAELQRWPQQEIMVTLECIENPVGGDSISNAVWRGVPLAAVLERVAPEHGAIDVVFKAADGYSDSIPLARARGGDVLLAHTMNGESLPREHGFPLRAVVPGIYGIKNVKWITEIEVTTTDYQGYWQQRGWSDLGVIPVTSRIDRPGAYQEIPLAPQTVSGIAFGGAAGISRVELSADGGHSWRPAALAPTPSPYTWVHWSLEWTPTRLGAHELIVRAFDGTGLAQIESRRRAFPDGPTGLHGITVDVIKNA
jgi:DMSO/TMAO reductase YedYZ molybdopterin-dependent catalytic subunit